MPQPPDFPALCRHALDSAGATATIALVTTDGGTLVSLVRRGTQPIDLVHAARTLLEEAHQWLDEMGGDAPTGQIDAVTDAIDCLPDPHAEDDDEDGA